ncbi:hypothetical protein OCU04_004763 [Sclerotinia nivalis]|uniref:Uncharacterized protein n=1 Tax=Sclerotinia nivalis TaxID=352851 RepID=A0A9X0DNV2_9HELO|nr:hypothetical protein OCU04_004763 [Sclerotinia nivalis]
MSWEWCLFCDDEADLVVDPEFDAVLIVYSATSEENEDDDGDDDGNDDGDNDGDDDGDNDGDDDGDNDGDDDGDNDGDDGNNTGNKRKQSKQTKTSNQNPEVSTPAKNTRNQSRKVSAPTTQAMENPRKRRWDSLQAAPEDTAPSEGEETDDAPLPMKKKAKSRKRT